MILKPTTQPVQTGPLYNKVTPEPLFPPSQPPLEIPTPVNAVGSDKPSTDLDYESTDQLLDRILAVYQWDLWPDFQPSRFTIGFAYDLIHAVGRQRLSFPKTDIWACPMDGLDLSWYLGSKSLRVSLRVTVDRNRTAWIMVKPFPDADWETFGIGNIIQPTAQILASALDWLVSTAE